MFLLICLPNVFLLTGAGTAILSLICIRCDIIRTPDPCPRPLRSRDITDPICTCNGFNFAYSYCFITTRMLIMSLMNILGPSRELRCPCQQRAGEDKERLAETRGNGSSEHHMLKRKGPQTWEASRSSGRLSILSSSRTVSRNLPPKHRILLL